MNLWIFWSFLLLHVATAANILFVNMWHSKSHGRTMMYFAESLVRRGHNVTMYSQVAAPIGSMGKGVLALESQLPENSKLTDQTYVAKLFWFEEMTPTISDEPHKIGYNFFDALKDEENFHKVLNTPYELAIVDEMFITSQAAIAFKLKEKFGTQISIFSTTDLFAYASNYRGLSRNFVTFPHSYIKGYTMYDFDIKRFYSRLSTSIEMAIEQIIFKFYCDPWVKKAGELIGVKTSLADIYSNSVISFTDYPLRYGTAIPRALDYVPVGEHCQKSSKLPEDLREFVEDPTSKGTVYVAFGSLVCWKAGPPRVIETFVKVFNSLKDYRIIWSYSGPELPEAASHIKVLKWAPQNDILAHPKTVLFFTHGGLKSLREGICTNTPLLFLPFFADQCKNAVYAIQMHLAEAIYKKNITEEELGTKIRRALTNEQMKTNVAKFHAHFTDNVIDSLDLGVFWAEKVLKMRSLPHARIRARDLSWCDYLYAELALILLVVLTILY